MTEAEAKEVLRRRYEKQIDWCGRQIYRVTQVILVNFGNQFLVCFEPTGTVNPKTGKRGSPYAGPFGRRHVKCNWPTEKEVETWKYYASINKTSSTEAQMETDAFELMGFHKKRQENTEEKHGL